MAAKNDTKTRERHAYFRNVADARHILRRVFRIAEEQARAEGIDPLKHQAMIQIYGSAESRLRVSRLAERLDISPAFASSLVRDLVEEGLAIRAPDPDDQRATLISLTGRAVDAIHRIDEAVAFHMEYFAASIPEEARERALTTLKQYAGFS